MDPDVTVWIARARTPDGREAVAWSAPDKAKGWVEHQSVVDVQWRDGDDRRIAESGDGEILGSVMPAKLMDPAAFANLFPNSVLSPRVIDPDDTDTDDKYEDVID